MFDKIILTFIAIMMLLGAAVIVIPIPVLWGMSCLAFALLSILHRQPQR